MKVERVWPVSPDKRQRYQSPAKSAVPEEKSSEMVGVDKITLSAEGKKRANELRDEQARQLVRRPRQEIDVEVTPTEAIEPIKK